MQHNGIKIMFGLYLENCKLKITFKCTISFYVENTVKFIFQIGNVSNGFRITNDS